MGLIRRLTRRLPGTAVLPTLGAIAIVAITLMTTAPALAETPLDRLDAARGDLRSLAFEAAIETPKPGGRLGRFTMTFEWLAPDRYRSEIRMGVEGQIITVADSARIETLATRTKQLHVQDRREAERRIRSFGPIDPLAALASPSIALASLFTIETSSVAGGRVTLVLVPKRAVPLYDRLKLVLTERDLTPLSAEATQRGQFVSRVIFRSFRRNAPIQAARFRLARPPGVTVVTLD